MIPKLFHTLLIFMCTLGMDAVSYDYLSFQLQHANLQMLICCFLGKETALKSVHRYHDEEYYMRKFLLGFTETRCY